MDLWLWRSYSSCSLLSYDASLAFKWSLGARNWESYSVVYAFSSRFPLSVYLQAPYTKAVNNLIHVVR